jgi:hypothetical protein
MATIFFFVRLFMVVGGVERLASWRTSARA